MTDKQLIAILAAIIIAPIDSEGSPSYTIDGAVKKAQAILREANRL